MSAQDYKICPAWSNVYLAKTSKRTPNLMLNDRRIITDAEIFGLIEWKFHQFTVVIHAFLVVSFFGIWLRVVLCHKNVMSQQMDLDSTPITMIRISYKSI